MKLLFDQNLSRKLPKKLNDLYPGSAHVIAAGLEHASDLQVRAFASQNGFVIATRDEDFADLDALLGPPPKVIWIQRVRVESNLGTDPPQPRRPVFTPCSSSAAATWTPAT